MFDFVADERNEPRYNRRMVRAEKTSPGAIELGARFRAELETAGRTMPMTIEFTGYDRPRRLASTTRSAMMTTEGALSFTPVADGTLMQWSWTSGRVACSGRCPRSSAGSDAAKSGRSRAI